MEAFIELLFETTDPVTAILLAVLIYHVRKIETRLSEDIARVRSRVERLEDPHIPDTYEFPPGTDPVRERDHERTGTGGEAASASEAASESGE